VVSSARFEEIDRRDTPIGEISVRRRLEPTLDIDVYEVKLGDEFLMSSLFTVAEIALADLGLAACTGDQLDVVVGGLGLGYTARAALSDARVRGVWVVEALGAVIGWHEQHLLPLAEPMTDDPRCHFVEGDFFALVAGDGPFAVSAPDRLHAVLLDVDHSPRHLLSETHAPFYEVAGLERLAARLHPGGVFGLWADGAPDDEFLATLEQVFATATAHTVTFPNFYTGADSSSTVYVATTAA
jgi:spermidine synthase